jgi:hypothetical protein
MRDPNPPSSGPDGPVSTTPQPGQRSGEGSDSVLEQMLRDSARKAADAATQQRVPARADQDAQAAR